MSRKHNTRHHRSRSRYPERLGRRGLTGASVRMPDLDTLRRRAGVRDPEPIAFGTLSGRR